MRDSAIIVVDDFQPWCRYVCSALQKEPGLQVICELSDGLEAVQRAEELTPDLIILDIGLPGLNGIEAARQILERSPNLKVLFFSEHQEQDIVDAALSTGARGYVLKSHAASYLVPAVMAVLRGEQFIRIGNNQADAFHA